MTLRALREGGLPDSRMEISPFSGKMMVGHDGLLSGRVFGDTFTLPENPVMS